MTVCEENQCAGCMACVDICPHGAIKIDDNMQAYNARIREDKCTHCGGCRRVCQKNHPVSGISPERWYQGWATEADVRASGASGGVATAIARAFIQSGGYVAGCVFKNGEFVFEIADNIENLDKFKGSKYAKSNPSGIYKNICRLLREGKKVLFIGLPCQAAALRLFVNEDSQKNLYIIDLICHGTPSPQILDVFLKQHGYDLKNISDIRFRRKKSFKLYGDNESLGPADLQDRYLTAFLNSLSYTENCYSCDYASVDRVADITLGDSWGSKLNGKERKKGISLLLCQTDKGRELIEKAELHLEDVDTDNAVKNNGQLQQPSVRPRNRAKFFNGLSQGQSFDKLVMQSLPGKCVRQIVKAILIRARLLRQ